MVRSNGDLGHRAGKRRLRLKRIGGVSPAARSNQNHPVMMPGKACGKDDVAASPASASLPDWRSRSELWGTARSASSAVLMITAGHDGQVKRPGQMEVPILKNSTNIQPEEPVHNGWDPCQMTMRQPNATGHPGYPARIRPDRWFLLPRWEMATRRSQLAVRVPTSAGKMPPCSFHRRPWR